MKKHFLIVIILLICFKSDAQWVWLNPKPQGNNLNSVHFINSIEGLSVGDNGTLIKTYDAGMSWEIISLGTNLNITSLTVIAENFGYAVGTNYLESIVLKTENYGSSWKTIYSSSANYNTIFFVNKTFGFLGGDKLLKTINGGDSWIEVQVPDASQILSICFLDTLTGFVTDMNRNIFKTSDGGTNWQQNTTDQPIFTLSFPSKNVGYAAGYWGIILKTTDSGNTWNELTNLTTTEFKSMYFFNDSTGFLAGGNEVFKTTDGGNNWTISSLYSSKFVWFSDFFTGFVVGGGGFIAKTTDGGNTWSEISVGIRGSLSSVSFPDLNTGYASLWGGFIKTTNGGSDWVKFNLDQYSSYQDICFINNMIGFTTGYRTGTNYYGFILKSYDGGMNWDTVKMCSGTILNHILFLDETTGFVLGDNETILKTSDSGNTWQEKNWWGDCSLYSICFCNRFTGYAVGGNALSYGYEGIILKTTDCGETWNVILNQGTEYPFNAVCFLNENVGYVAGGDPFYAGGVIMKTTDGGNNWEVQLSGTNTIFSGLHFLDEERGIVVGYEGADMIGKIYITYDGGNTWMPQSVNIPEIKSLCFTNDTIGFITGENGSILKTSCAAGLVTGMSYPVFADQCNVYPNPAHTKLFIKHATSIYCQVGIFNLQGILISRQKVENGGSINISGLEKGVYILRVTDETDQIVGKEKLIVE